MKKPIILLVLLIGLNFSVKSQVTWLDNIETNIASSTSSVKFDHFGELGIILSSLDHNSYDYETDNNGTEFIFEKFDSTLNFIEEKRFSLPGKYYLNADFKGKKHLHKLLRNSNGNFSLLSAETSTTGAIQVNGQFPKKLIINGMVVLGDNAFISASLKKEPFIYIINWKTGEQKNIPIIIENTKKAELISLQSLENSKELIAYVKAKTSSYKLSAFSIRLNVAGEIVETLDLSKDIKENILDVNITKTSNNEYLYTGRYSTSASSKKSAGLFFCKVKDGEVSKINLYNFYDFENFISDKVKGKIRGGIIKSGYQINQHDLILLNDGYLYIGEAYYPTFRTETTRTYSHQTKAWVTKSVRVFDGFEYTHIIIIKFDQDGNILANKNLSIDPTKPYVIKEFISVIKQESTSIGLLYTHGRRISSIDINSNSQQGHLMINFNEDKIKIPLDEETNYYKSSVEYWYDNYCIEHGTLKETETTGKGLNIKFAEESSYISINKMQFE